MLPNWCTWCPRQYVSRDIEGGHLDWGTLQLVRVRAMVDWQCIHQGGGVWAHSPLPRLRVWGSRGGSYWTSRAHMRSGYGRHVRGFIPWNGGSPSRVDTHGKVPRMTKIFDDS